eukprot:m.582049 g.582049  ORF g.582049 m.582049 type:complete len:169 (+) comp57941_c0_seq25:1468-1974(+)
MLPAYFWSRASSRIPSFRNGTNTGHTTETVIAVKRSELQGIGEDSNGLIPRKSKQTLLSIGSSVKKAEYMLHVEEWMDGELQCVIFAFGFLGLFQNNTTQQRTERAQAAVGRQNTGQSESKTRQRTQTNTNTGDQHEEATNTNEHECRREALAGHCLHQLLGLPQFGQ